MGSDLIHGTLKLRSSSKRRRLHIRPNAQRSFACPAHRDIRAGRFARVRDAMADERVPMTDLPRLSHLAASPAQVVCFGDHCREGARRSRQGTACDVFLTVVYVRAVFLRAGCVQRRGNTARSPPRLSEETPDSAAVDLAIHGAASNPAGYCALL